MVRLNPFIFSHVHGMWSTQMYLFIDVLFIDVFLCVGVKMAFSLSALTDNCSSL